MLPGKEELIKFELPCYTLLFKKMNFKDISDDQVEIALMRLNHRCRKCLEFLSPFMVFFYKIQSVANNT